MAGMNARLVATDIHRLAVRELQALVVNPAAVDMTALRQEFLRHTLALREVANWQAAWQSFAARGSVRITPARCTACRGRRYNPGSISRTGSPICHVCRGTGRGTPTLVRLRALPQPEPDSA